MRRSLFLLFALCSCRLFSGGLTQTCNLSDGSFLRCNEEQDAKIVCQSGVEVSVLCGGGCVEGAADCAELACGDGEADPGEECDTNDLNGQTCTNIGQGFEQGTLSCKADCTLDTVDCSACPNGVTEADEQCDDNNQSNDDDCVEGCVQAACGDGFVRTNVEACDDGNNQSGDGCSSACAIEAGFLCSGTPSSCATDCGDTIPAGQEECDDGNNVDGDGCSADCVDEVCGDGVVNNAPEEECDGDDLNGNTCQSEGFTSGTLACSAGCALDTSNCVIAQSCGPITPLFPQPPNPVTGTGDTANGNPNSLTGIGCQVPQTGKELIFQVPSPPDSNPHTMTARLTITDPTNDMSVYIYKATCGVGSASCGDLFNQGATTETASVTVNTPSTAIFVVVDSKTPGDEGAFSVEVSVQ